MSAPDQYPPELRDDYHYESTPPDPEVMCKINKWNRASMESIAHSFAAVDITDVLQHHIEMLEKADRMRQEAELLFELKVASLEGVTR